MPPRAKSPGRSAAQLGRSAAQLGRAKTPTRPRRPITRPVGVPAPRITLFGVPTKSFDQDPVGFIDRMKKNIERDTKAVRGDGPTPWQDDIRERIPRAEMDAHMAFIAKVVPHMTPAGSYRRGVADSADIDVVVREPIADVVARLVAADYIAHTFGSGTKKFSGVVRLPRGKYRHLDIVFTTPRCYPFAMLYFTGSARFNILMRLSAKRQGYKLNEYGLWRGLRLIDNIHTERDIFTQLKLPWREPSMRL